VTWCILQLRDHHIFHEFIARREPGTWEQRSFAPVIRAQRINQTYLEWPPLNEAMIHTQPEPVPGGSIIEYSVEKSPVSSRSARTARFVFSNPGALCSPAQISPRILACTSINTSIARFRKIVFRTYDEGYVFAPEFLRKGGSELKLIELALQGGGAHGAFTWGVLDYLLGDDRVRIEGICGTSAGAMNAVVMADGLDRGGKEEAREALNHFWAEVSSSAMFSPFQRSPMDRLLGRWTLDTSAGFIAFDLLSRLVSPYELNPFDFNPLRMQLAALVDFEHVRHAEGIKLFVAATNVRTGKQKVFRREEMTVDMVMASACLPFLFHAVEIDGEAYWDGGYMGNPALFPLVEECGGRDVVIVQINPIHREEIPRRAADILNRVNEISFNAALIKEVRTIALLKKLIQVQNLQEERFKDVYFHRINADVELRELSVSSKLNAEWAFLKHLHDVGYRTTEAWLNENYEFLGNRSTLDIDAVYL
jgi:NTE family protein